MFSAFTEKSYKAFCFWITHSKPPAGVLILANIANNDSFLKNVFYGGHGFLHKPNKPTTIQSKLIRSKSAVVLFFSILLRSIAHQWLFVNSKFDKWCSASGKVFLRVGWGSMALTMVGR